MKIKTLITSFLLFFSLSLFSQKIVEGKILWTEDYQLEWVDFKAKPQKDHFATALSNIIFSIKINSEGNKLYVIVQPSLDPFASWVKSEGKSDYLLNHEQMHFNIYEVNARKMRKELKTTKITRSNAESVLNRMVKKYSKMNVKVQKKYDKSTKHSLNTKKQQEWNERIENELKELKVFREVEFSVNIQ